MITEETETENMIAPVVEVAMTRVLDGTTPTPLGRIGSILKTCLPSARTFTRSTRTLPVVHRYGPPKPRLKDGKLVCGWLVLRDYCP